VIELTLGGLLGAMAGAIVGGANYAMLIGYLDGLLKSMEGAETERDEFAENVSLMRRMILAFDVLICAGIGYWLGTGYLSPAIGAGLKG
jgi:hypothetical protein